MNAKDFISSKDIEIYGPFESPVQKQSHKYRMFCIMQSQNKELIKESLSSYVNEIVKNKKTISAWVLDVDPINAA